MDLEVLAAHFKNGTTPLIRTDFSDDAAWTQVMKDVLQPVFFDGEDVDDMGGGDYDGYVPGVVAIDDQTFEGTTPEALAALARAGLKDALAFVLLADSESIRGGCSGEASELFVDLSDDDEELPNPSFGRAFRCWVSEVAANRSQPVRWEHGLLRVR